MHNICTIWIISIITRQGEGNEHECHALAPGWFWNIPLTIYTFSLCSLNFDVFKRMVQGIWHYRTIYKIFYTKLYLWVLCLMWNSGIIMGEPNSENQPRTRAESMALIPYKPPVTGLEIFQVSERNFTFAGKSLEIQQKLERSWCCCSGLGGGNCFSPLSWTTRTTVEGKESNRTRSRYRPRWNGSCVAWCYSNSDRQKNGFERN